MRSDILNAKNKPNGIIAIIVFSALAILSGGISGLLFSINNIIDAFDYFNFDDLLLIITGFTDGLFIVLTALSLALYTLFFYKKNIGRFCLAVSLILLSLSIFNSIIIQTYYIFSSGISFLEEYFYISALENIRYMIKFSLPRVFLPVAAILILFKVNKKWVYIILITVFLFEPIGSLTQYFNTLTDFYLWIYGRNFIMYILEWWAYIIGQPLWIIANFAIGIAFIILFAENFSYSLKTVNSEKSIDEMSSQQALVYLRKKLDSGKITAEEYQSQREIIIGKL